MKPTDRYAANPLLTEDNFQNNLLNLQKGAARNPIFPAAPSPVSQIYPALHPHISIIFQ